MMNSKEIVRRTLNYDHPDRVARSFGLSDFVSCGHTVATHATEWAKVSERRWERVDEWGNLWARVDPTSKGEVVAGVLKDVSDAGHYVFPDFSNPADYAVAAETAAAHPEKWTIGGLPGFTFNIARKLFKLENYLCDLLLEPEAIHRLHDRIDEQLVYMIENYAAAGVDSVMFPEDWGTQTQTLISPSVWREEFFPRFVRLCQVAHARGIKVFMHSCGAIGAIIPGLMEAGIDLLQFDQPILHGLDTLAAYQEKGKITFWCPVDIQKTLQTRDEQAIRQEARQLLEKLWRGRGGFVAGYYGDNTSIGLDPKWQEIASDEFMRRGTRKAMGK
ncbi:MAG: hypothetical protein GX173_10710 [Ruminococcaceae bacterium]|nr:hypothetical protein [Oscillospiraceae bacterium]